MCNVDPSIGAAQDENRFGHADEVADRAIGDSETIVIPGIATLEVRT